MSAAAVAAFLEATRAGAPLPSDPILCDVCEFFDANAFSPARELLVNWIAGTALERGADILLARLVLDALNAEVLRCKRIATIRLEALGAAAAQFQRELVRLIADLEDLSANVVP